MQMFLSYCDILFNKKVSGLKENERMSVYESEKVDFIDTG